jgi:aspartate/glutamate racemase
MKGPAMNSFNQILEIKDITMEYGLSRDFTYELLNRSECKLVSGKNRKKYRINRVVFEELLYGSVIETASEKDHRIAEERHQNMIISKIQAKPRR